MRRWKKTAARVREYDERVAALRVEFKQRDWEEVLPLSPESLVLSDDELRERARDAMHAWIALEEEATAWIARRPLARILEDREAAVALRDATGGPWASPHQPLVVALVALARRIEDAREDLERQEGCRLRWRPKTREGRTT